MGRVGVRTEGKEGGEREGEETRTHLPNPMPLHNLVKHIIEPNKLILRTALRASKPSKRTCKSGVVSTSFSLSRSLARRARQNKQRIEAENEAETETKKNDSLPLCPPGGGASLIACIRGVKFAS